MTTQQMLLAAVLGLALAAGCDQALPGTTRNLGPVQYDQAFCAAREVLSQYYSIESADAGSGKIIARPQTVDAPADRVVGSSPARHLTQMRIRREGPCVSAFASVALQRQTTESFRERQRVGGDNYSSVPDQTPADKEAATTADQNDVWITQRYDHAAESRMLDDLFRRLHPNPADADAPQQCPAR